MKAKLALHGGMRSVNEDWKVRWPVIRPGDREAVLRVVDRGILWGMTSDDFEGHIIAPEMHALEEEFARYCGSRYCLAVNGGTAAVHMAIAAAGVGPGDEVITSSFSFLATAAAILHHNAIPVFVDIEPETFNLDVNRIEEKITERTRAILPVHIHGICADMDKIHALARKYGLVVIEDACQAPGALYKGKKAGTLGDMAAFSLNGTKNLAVGEGGLFVTDVEEFRNRANVIRQIGETLPPEDGGNRHLHQIGWNYRTQEMPCAFARSQLSRLESINATARRNAEFLSRQLSGIEGIQPPLVPAGRTSVYHKYRVRLEPEKLGLDVQGVEFRNLLLSALRAEGVDVVLWETEPLPAAPIFQAMQGYGRGCPWTCTANGANLPVYRAQDYPETVKLLDNSIVVCSELHPIYCQPLELIQSYAEAFHKVFNNLDQLIAGASTGARALQFGLGG